MPISNAPSHGLDDVHYIESDLNSNNNDIVKVDQRNYSLSTNDNHSHHLNAISSRIAVVENHPFSNGATPDRVAARIREELEQAIMYMDLSPNSRDYSSNERDACFESFPIVNELMWDHDDLVELSNCTNSSAEAPSSNLYRANLRFNRLL